MKKKKERTFWKDFKAFISRGNVVDMAIGVAVAGAFSAIVSKFTAAFVSPLIALLTDGASLADLKWIARPEVLDAEGKVLIAEVSFAWGAFVQAIIDFLIIAFALFIVLRVFTKAANKAKEMRLAAEAKDAEEAAAKDAAAKKAEEEARLAAEKAAEEAHRAAEAEAAAAKACEVETVELLREIRNSLAKK